MDLIVNEDLINKVRAIAGRDIHDTESFIGLYKANAKRYNKYIKDESTLKIAKETASYAYPDKSVYESAKIIFIKAERILYSFLVTHNIKLSEKLVKDALREEGVI